jgi:hypothetical protein
MNKSNVASLLLAFALGVLLTLLLASRFNHGPYVPLGPAGEQILDTRNGRVYAKTAGRTTWHVFVQRVGAE